MIHSRFDTLSEETTIKIAFVPFWKRDLLPVGANYFLLEYTLFRRGLVRRKVSWKSQNMSPLRRMNITKTRLFKYTENFTTKNDNFKIKYSDIFHISAQNIGCGYSLEPHR